VTRRDVPYHQPRRTKLALFGGVRTPGVCPSNGSARDWRPRSLAQQGPRPDSGAGGWSGLGSYSQQAGRRPSKDPVRKGTQLEPASVAALASKESRSSPGCVRSAQSGGGGRHNDMTAPPAGAGQACYDARLASTSSPRSEASCRDVRRDARCDGTVTSKRSRGSNQPGRAVQLQYSPCPQPITIVPGPSNAVLLAPPPAGK
jgi:hypothetical protein